MHNRKQKQKQKQKESMESTDHDLSFRKIMKDVELFSSSHMTWKERKELENKTVVTLGGKPPKKQRLPLSVARVQMKKQKEREQKMLEQNMILGRFGGKFGGSNKKTVERRKPEDRVLKATEGNFRNGVLDVKNLLRPSRDNNRGSDTINHGKKNKKEGRQRRKGQKKGGKRKRN